MGKRKPGVPGLIRQYLGFRRELYILFFGRLVTAVGSMAWPLLTLILSQKLHLGASPVATIIAVTGLAMIPLNMLGGWLADHRDKRKCIMVCDLISVIGYLICAFTPLSYISVALIIISSGCQRMENSMYNALVADLTKTEERERAYSLEYLGCNLGFVIAPTMAGLLFNHYLWLAFLISGVSILISTINIFLFVRDIHAEVDTEAVSGYQDDRSGDSILKILMENKTVFLYLLVMGLYFAAYGQGSYLMPLELSRVHGERGAILYGSITSVNAFIVVIFTPVFTALLTRFTTLSKTWAGWAMVLVGYGIFRSWLGTIPVYYMAMILFTFGEILTTITNGPYLTARIPASHRGRISGLMFVFEGLLQSVILEITGLLYGGSGSDAAWIFVLGMCVLILILGAILIPLDRRRYPALY